MKPRGVCAPFPPICLGKSVWMCQHWHTQNSLVSGCWLQLVLCVTGRDPAKNVFPARTRIPAQNQGNKSSKDLVANKARAPAAQLSGSGYRNLIFLHSNRTGFGAGCYFGCCRGWSQEGAALQVLAVSLAEQGAVPAALSCAGPGAELEPCL